MANNKITLVFVGLLIIALIGGALWYGTTNQKTPKEPELTHGTWLWQETQLNSGEVVRPNKTDAFTITFTEDGSVSGDTDCNSFKGTYTKDSGRAIIFGAFATTKKFCEGSQEAQFIRMITDSDSFMFTPSGLLVLSIKFDSGSVIFYQK